MRVTKTQLTGEAAWFEVYDLCCRKHYFTGGGVEAYDKFKEMITSGTDLYSLACMLYMVSDATFEVCYNDLSSVLLRDIEK